MKAILTLLLLFSAPAWAAPYKCVIDNKTEYRDSPCPPGTEKPLQAKPLMDSSPAQRDEAQKRLEADKQRAQALERARLEKQAAAERKKAAEAEAAKKQQEAAPKKETDVTPEEGAKQGAAGRTYHKDRPQTLPMPKK
jgi:hypothetical protein